MEIALKKGTVSMYPPSRNVYHTATGQLLGKYCTTVASADLEEVPFSYLWLEQEDGYWMILENCCPPRSTKTMQGNYNFIYNHFPPSTSCPFGYLKVSDDFCTRLSTKTTQRAIELGFAPAVVIYQDFDDFLAHTRDF